MHKFTSFIALCSLVILLSACSLAADITPPPGSVQEPSQKTAEPAATSPVYPLVPPDLASGEKIYNQECAPCHGTQGLGDGPQSAQLSVPVATLGLSDFARLYTPADWYAIVTQGSGNRFMPAFANLTDRQRWDVVAYAMNLSVSADAVTQGEVLYGQNCLTCHGPAGKGDGPTSTGLTTQAANLTDQSFMAHTSAAILYQAISSGVSPDMPAFSTALTESEQWSIVAYLRSLTFTPSQVINNAPTAIATGDTASLDSPTNPATQVSSSTQVSQNQAITTTEEITSSMPFTGTVAVQLINGSGGDPPAEAPVTLYGFDAMQNTYSETLTTGVDGIYTFSNVYMPPERVFLAGTEYSSGSYGSDVISVDPSTPDLKLQITVYESTSDITALSTDRVHIFFDFSDPKNVQVIEVFIISNSSEQAVVASTSNGGVVTFPLPKGYTNLQFQDGELGNRYVEVEGGFADSVPVSPGVGQYQVIFAFQMPYDQKLDFAQSMFLPTSAVVIMVPEGGVKIDSSQLQDSGTRDFQGTSYRMYDGSSLLAGSTLEFTLSGTPAQASATVVTKSSGQNLAIGLGAFGVVLVAVGLWMYRRNQLNPARQVSSSGEPYALVESPLGAIPEDADTLMDAIITLDDQYHAGNLPEKAYLERRAVLKDKLRSLDQG